MFHTYSALQSSMRLQIEIPPFVHCDASVDHGTGMRVVTVPFIRMICIGRIETSMMALADDDNGESGWLQVFLAIHVRAHPFHRFQFQLKDSRVLTFGDAC